MKIVLCLIVAFAVWVVAWNSPAALRSSSAPTSELSEPSALPDSSGPSVSAVTQAPNPTPLHPAREAQAEAMTLYPGLARADSALNRTFLVLYREAKVSNPELLSQPDWPLQLADQAMIALGGTPYTATVASLGTIPSLSSLAAFGNSALNTPPTQAAQVRSVWPYYYPRYYVASNTASNTSCQTAASTTRSPGFANRPTSFGGATAQTERPVYRSRLETGPRYSAGATPRSALNSPRASTSAFSPRGTTVSGPQPNPPRCNPAPRSTSSAGTASSSGGGRSGGWGSAN